MSTPFPLWLRGAQVGVLRYNFLLEALSDLDGGLRRLGSRLYVVRGKPEAELPKLWKRWKVSRLVFEYDSEPYAKVRDGQISKAATAAGLGVEVHHSHTLHELDKYLAKNRGEVGRCVVWDHVPLSLRRFTGQPAVPSSLEHHPTAWPAVAFGSANSSAAATEDVP